MGKYGIQHTKNLISLGKIGVIAILQDVQRNGFQFSDLAAPMKSPTFLQHYSEAIKHLEDVVLEVGELEFMEKVELAKHFYDCGKDISTDLKLAVAAIKNRKKTLTGATANA